MCIHHAAISLLLPSRLGVEECCVGLAKCGATLAPGQVGNSAVHDTLSIRADRPPIQKPHYCQLVPMREQAQVSPNPSDIHQPLVLTDRCSGASIIFFILLSDKKLTSCDHRRRQIYTDLYSNCKKECGSPPGRFSSKRDGSK